MFNKIGLILGLGIILLIQSCNLSDISKNLGNRYFYRNEGGDIKDILCERPAGAFIPATILEYDYNRYYIIANQKPKIPQDPLYDAEFEYKNGADAVYYWIIIKKKDIVLGPMTKDEYMSARKEYNVSEKLKLD
ncbi:MAG: hypothetical protein PF448_03995 [Bacteroidales bacterium]|jgi:hypothetical protein|nr:hypothetical protein [Bacteroidales bacterium]